MNKNSLISELKQTKNNLHFSKLCNILEKLGFEFKGGKGSHRVYTHPMIRELLNFQNVSGKAKPYQINQLIKIIEKYQLFNEENTNE